MRRTLTLDGVELDRVVKPWCDEHYRIDKPIDAPLTAAIKEAIAAYVSEHTEHQATDNHVELTFHCDTRGNVRLKEAVLHV